MICLLYNSIFITLLICLITMITELICPFVWVLRTIKSFPQLPITCTDMARLPCLRYGFCTIWHYWMDMCISLLLCKKDSIIRQSYDTILFLSELYRYKPIRSWYDYCFGNESSGYNKKHMLTRIKFWFHTITFII